MATLWLAPLAARAQVAPAEPPAIVVQAQKLVVQHKVDRVVYQVNNSVLATGLGAAELLQAVPGVSVSPGGGVSLRGDSQVVILVDGRPSPLVSTVEGLANFPADQIERVEVMTTPPAEYQAIGTAGVINLVTKKNGGPQGLSGDVRGNLAWKGRGKIIGELSYKQGPLTLSGAGALRHTYTAGETVSNQLADGSDLASRRADRSRQPIDWADLKAELSLAKTDFALSGHHWEVGGETSFLQSLSADGATPALLTGSGSAWTATDNLEASLDQKLGLTGEDLKLDFQDTLNLGRDHTFFNPLGTYTNDGSDQRTDELMLDYVRPLLKEGELKAGFDLKSDRYLFSLISIEGGAPATASLRLDSGAVYLEQSFTVRQWLMQAGLRWEEGDLVFSQAGVDQREHLYRGLFPSLHLERSLGAHDRLTFALSRRLNQPDGSDLDPFANTTDPTVVTKGDPLLKPEDRWSLEAGYADDRQGVSRSLSLFARQSSDAQTTFFSADGPGVLLSQQVNLRQSHRLGIEAEADGNLGKTLSYKLSGEGYRQDIESVFGGSSGLDCSGKLSLTYKPMRADTLEATFGRDADALLVQGVDKGYPYINFAYRHEFGAHFAFSIVARNLPDLQKQGREVRAANLIYKWNKDADGNLLYFGFSYSFGHNVSKSDNQSLAP